MRIGVDVSTWNNRRGFGRFTRELLEAVIANDSKNEYVFFADRETLESGELPEGVETVIVQTTVSPMEAASSSGRRSFKDLWTMSRAVWKYKIDIFFFPAVFSYYPILNRCKIVVTLHDVIADHHPELVFPNSRLRFFWKLKQKAAIRQAHLVLTVSDYSKREILEYFRLPENKVRVVTEAARSVFKVLPKDSREISETLDEFGLDTNNQFLLYVGGISPHKNLSALISALREIAADPAFSNIKLVLVGDYKDDPFFSAYPELKKQIAELDLSEKVIFTGYIDDLKLAHLYNACAFVTLPSFEEGFGLPAVEAMACAAPVAASDRGSLPEVLGNAGRFFDPTSPKNMAEVMRRILSDKQERNEMGEAGLLRSREFLWNKAAKDLIALFNEL